MTHRRRPAADQGASMKIRVFAALALTIFLAAFLVACDDGSDQPELPVTAQNQVTPAPTAVPPTNTPYLRQIRLFHPRQHPDQQIRQCRRRRRPYRQTHPCLQPRRRQTHLCRRPTHPCRQRQHLFRRTHLCRQRHRSRRRRQSRLHQHLSRPLHLCRRQRPYHLAR